MFTAPASGNPRLRNNYKKAFIVYLSFILLMLLVLFPLLNVSLNALKERTLKNAREALSAAMERLESELDRSQRMCRYLYDMEAYQHFIRSGLGVTSRDVTNILEIQDQYDNLYNMLSIIDDIGLYMSNGVLMLSRRIHVPGERVWDVFFTVRGENSLDGWLDSLEDPDSPNYSFSAAQLKRYDDRAFDTFLVFCFDVGIMNKLATRCFVLMRESDLLESFALGEVLDYSHLRLDWSGRSLTDRTPEKMGGEIVSLNLQSREYQLNVRLDIDKSFFNASLRPFYRFCTLFMMAYLLLGIGLSLWFSRRSVRPLRATLEAIDEATGLYLSTEGNDAYACIKQFIQLADKRLKESRLALANQEVLLKENLLERILRGHIFHDDVGGLLHQHFPTFPLPCVMIVLAFSGADSQTPQTLAELQIRVRSEIDTMIGESTFLHFSAQMAVLILPDSELPDDDTLQVLGECIEESGDCHVHICVGREIRCPDEISVSFLRMRQLLRLLNENELLVHESQVSNTLDLFSFRYPSNFYEALIRNNLSFALEQLNENQQLFMQNPCASEIEIQQLFYAYRQSLSQAIAVNGLPAEQIVLPRYDPNACLNDLMDGIRQCAEHLCSVQKQLSEAQITQREQEILSAIDAGLSDPDFCIDSMSETYNISNRSLQSLVRATKGTSFMDYVNASRMALAKHLLQTTDISIQDIAIQCGYRSNNTFYKAFQRAWETSPNVMRKSSRLDT